MGRTPVAQLIFHWILEEEMRAQMPRECEEHLEAWPRGYSLGRMGLGGCGGWAPQIETWVVERVVPTAEEPLRNERDKLTHSEDDSGPRSPADPSRAQ